MTIHNEQLNKRLQFLQRCADAAPEGTYEVAKSAYAAVDEAIESVRSIFKEHGFKALGDDRCRNLEIEIYGFLLESNPTAYGLITGEAFGEHIDGPAGQRVMANTLRDRDNLRALGLA